MGIEGDLCNEIGSRVRAIRRLQKRTVQELADAPDLSKSMISKIKKGYGIFRFASKYHHKTMQLF